MDVYEFKMRQKGNISGISEMKYVTPYSVYHTIQYDSVFSNAL